MRQRDIEVFEVHLEPLRIAKDRHESTLRDLIKTCEGLANRVKDLERDGEAHSTSIAQGLASVRSLLQRANRAARAVEEEEEAVVAEPVPPVNIRQHRDDVIRAARTQPGRGHLL